MTEPTASLDQALAHAARLLASDPVLAGAQAEEILKVVGDHPMALLLLGASHSVRRDHARATQILSRLGLDRDTDGVKPLERALELAPSFHAARQKYAMLLNRADRPSEALQQVETLLALDPANPSYRNLKAAILCRLGDYGQAIELYEALLREYPRHPKILLSHGHALKTAGQQDRAIRAYRRSIEFDPGFGEAWWSLANLKTFRFDEDDVRRMAAQLERLDLDPGQRLEFEFALGKALEDRGEYEASFQHYLRGNAARRRMIPYSADENSNRIRQSIDFFSRERFDSHAGSGLGDPDPIFIVGLPRAGSTLVEQVLSSHSQVEGTMELPEVTGLTRSLRQRTGAPASASYTEALADIEPEALREMGRTYLESTRVHRKRGAPFFIDKMPNNFAFIGLIHLILPNARIIDARRHPMACCFSGFKQHFARGQNFTYDLADIGRYYRDYAGLMEHFDRVLPGRVHRVHYEAMVDDTEGEVRRLLDYCGLPFEPGCLRFFENSRPVRTASSEQVRQPIFREGLEQWRHYEPWLGALREALGSVLES